MPQQVCSPVGCFLQARDRRRPGYNTVQLALKTGWHRGPSMDVNLCPVFCPEGHSSHHTPKGSPHLQVLTVSVAGQKWEKLWNDAEQGGADRVSAEGAVPHALILNRVGLAAFV